MPIELKSCPWCGSPAVLRKQNRANYIYCPNPHSICPVSPNTRHWTASNLKNVIKAWNQRHEGEVK